MLSLLTRYLRDPFVLRVFVMAYGAALHPEINSIGAGTNIQIGRDRGQPFLNFCSEVAFVASRGHRIQRLVQHFARL